MYIIMALVNIICICLGFYLGRITKGEASGPSMPTMRILPRKPVGPEQDPYYDAMYGEEKQATPTVEAKQ